MSSSKMNSAERERFELAARALLWPDTAFKCDEIGIYITPYTECSRMVWQTHAATPDPLGADDGNTFIVPDVPMARGWV